MVLLGAAVDRLAENGICFVANDPKVIRTFSDKAKTFEHLAGLGFSVPRTTRVSSEADLAAIGMPCIIKPSTGSGGSAMVWLAADAEEASMYAGNILRAGGSPIAQEYIDPSEGEFTVGVLSLTGGEIVGSIALRRSLDSKLSVAFRGRQGVISTGYTQGYIADFPAIRTQAEAISLAIGSQGALNIQGRVRNGEFIPFEINPRLSASTYLRAMAGFNEIDLLLQRMAFNDVKPPGSIREGWYLRSFTELFVPPQDLKT